MVYVEPVKSPLSVPEPPSLLPTRSQIDRMTVLAAELEGANATFEAAKTKNLAPLNAELAKKKIDPIVVGKK